MTNEKNTKDSKVNPYVFTEAIFAAVTIDGIATAMFLGMPFVPIGLGVGAANALKYTVQPETFKTILKTSAPVIELGYSSLSTVFPIVSSIKEYMFYTGLGIISGFSTYVIRDYTRYDFKEAGYEHYNGALGGGVKYIETEIASQLFNTQSISIPKTIYKTLLGGRNNFKYEECTANEECNKKALEFVVKTESEEAQIDAEIMMTYHSYNAIFNLNSDSIKFINNPNYIALKAMGGRIIGEVVSEVCIKHLFIPNIKSVQKVSDVVCQEYPVLITTKDLFSEAMDITSYSILFGSVASVKNSGEF